jgi:hypothetical protein
VSEPHAEKEVVGASVVKHIYTEEHLNADTSTVIANIWRAVHLHGLADEEHSYVIKKHGEQKAYGTLSRELSQML